jgi:hypothetical protein
MPQREVLTPPEIMDVVDVLVVPLSTLTEPTHTSAMPYRVTEDWAIAAPEAAKTAKATSDFFISNISKVKTSGSETFTAQNPEPTS